MAEGEPVKLFKLLEQPEVILSKIKDPEERSIFAQACEVSPMRYWCPNGAQEKYIKAVAESYESHPIPVTLATFGNGVGKTTASVHILLNIILGAQNGWFDYPLFTEPFKHPKLAWIMSTAEAIDGTIIPLIDSLVPKKYTKYKLTKNKRGKAIVSEMLLEDWMIKFKTFDQDPKTYESANVGVGIIDEPQPEELWKAYKSRRRMGNITLMPMTPLDCPPYIIDEVSEKASAGEAGFKHMTASVYDACKSRGKRGHLDPVIIDAMVDGYDAEERDARAFGRFMYFSGMIYPEWDDKVHIVAPGKYKIPEKCDIYQIVDPHDGRFSASIWAYAYKLESGEDRVVVFGDAPDIRDRFFWQFKRSTTILEEVRGWMRLEDKWGIGHRDIYRVMDKNFGWQTRGGNCLADLYAEAGETLGRDFAFSPSYDAPSKQGEIHYGHKMVKQYLSTVLSDGKPAMVFWRTATHAINGLKHYIRKKMTGKASDDFATADGKIVEKYKDFPDTVRYLACERPVGTVSERPLTEAELDIEALFEQQDAEENNWDTGVVAR